ncbi:MAG: murD [Gammaproteobacteria bacterium]|jgi:UDP-N-acetylmuramoylalanine--D-glutamate ligase|nr:murD [Gammaproteobacteria bacterium]
MTKEGLNVIVGLGVTGLSCAQYLARQAIPFALIDTRSFPPHLAEFKRLFPDVPLSLGCLDNVVLNKASRIIISPGISLQEHPIRRQFARGVPIIGDIELFAQTVQAPVIAITGTNAKSTVTTLVGEMAAAAGVKVQVGGNLGTPVLDLLSATDTELFVLELSSFQLETTFSLKPAVATILNITPDHMDRYNTLEDYCKAKQHIYSNCHVAVFNKDDPLTDCGEQFHHHKFSFTLNEPKAQEFGLLKKNKETYLAFENQLLLSVRELPILGRHYQANALAALAIGHGYGWSFEPMLQTLRYFKGLPHRCQLVREHHGVRWYNDSKGTNVGATLAAIEGLGSAIEGKLILIAGGVGKNADFSPLVVPMEKYVRSVVLIGEAALVLSAVVGDRVEVNFAKSMEEAVAVANKIAIQGDSVLLSPACASLDMFNNFEHRGQVFTQVVQELA